VAIFQEWLARRPGQEVRLRDIYKSGPRVVRDRAADCFTLMREMELRGIVEPRHGGAPKGTPATRRTGASYIWRVAETAELSPGVS
jgi:hypothetical protein